MWTRARVSSSPFAGLAFLTFLLLAFTEGASAQPSERDDDRRTLAGHRFVPFRTVVYPFVVDRVGATSSVGVADVELEIEDVPEVGDRYSADGTLAFLDSSFAGQLALAPFFALRASVGVGVTGGANAIGAIDVGANAGAALGAGFVARLFGGERAILSLVVDGQILRALGVSPKRLLTSFDVVDDQVVVRSIDVTYDARVLRLDPSLALAIAFTRAVGLQLGAGYSVRHVEAILGFDAGTEHSIHGDLGLSFFFGGAALLVGARLVHDFDEEFLGSVISAIEPLDPTRGEAELGLYYTAREALDLGVVGIGSLSGDDRRLQGLLSLAYYW